jgi:hypothetical protein
MKHNQRENWYGIKHAQLIPHSSRLYQRDVSITSQLKRGRIVNLATYPQETMPSYLFGAQVHAEWRALLL